MKISSVGYKIQQKYFQGASGEWSYVFFNGKYSHCVLKTPKKGDFRVQHYHGGSITYPQANPKHIKQAEEFVFR